MKCAARIILLLFMASLLNQCAKETQTSENQPNNIFASRPPVSAPELFGPNFISTNLYERDFALDHDGKTLYYTLQAGRTVVIVSVKQNADGEWGEPEIAPFSGQYRDLEPIFSPDGKRLYFASNRPLQADGKAKDYDIWFVERTETGWGGPQNPGAPLNTEGNEFYPSLTHNGKIYITAKREGGLGGEDVVFFERRGDKWDGPSNPGEAINSARDEFNAYVAADDSFLMFSSFGREDGLGGGDLYIAFRGEDGAWQKAKNMGEKINSNALDFCPSVSPDGKIFFFTSQRTSPELGSDTKKNFKGLVSAMNAPGNGGGDIYWLDFNVIAQMKNE